MEIGTKIMTKIQAIEFSEENCHLYSLSIAITKENFLIYIFYKSKLIYFSKIKLLEKNYNDITTNHILKLDFKKTEIIIFGYPHTIVPSEFFDEKNASLLLSTNAELLDVIKFHKIPEISAIAIYSLQEELDDLLNLLFPETIPEVIQSRFISEFFKKSGNDEIAHVYISFEIIHICIFSKGKLILTNSYDYKNNEDILYYILFAFEQLKLDPSEIKTRLYGDIAKNNHKFKLLYKYIRDIDIEKLENNYKVNDQFFESTNYFDVNLLSI